MRAVSVAFLILSSLGCSATGVRIWAQEQQAEDRQTSVHAQDGGMRQVLESIVVPPLPKAPFSCILQTEWIRPLAGGGTLTMQNQRKIARDSSGRIYQERWYLVPKNGKETSEMNFIQISDPIRHILSTCSMDRHVCELTKYAPSYSSGSLRQRTPGPLPGGAGFTTRESLGVESIEGLDATGTLETTTINAWIEGNDRPMKGEWEYWSSSRLGFNLRSRRADPMLGTQDFKVTNLSLSEPEPQLFMVPEGFKVVDQRDAALPQQ